MNKLRIILFLGSWLLALSAFAQTNVRDAFIVMPDTLCPFFDTQQRAYMVNRALVGDTIANRLNGKSVITEQTDSTLRIHIAEGVEYTLRMHTDTITFIQTVCAPVCASIVKQYKADWTYLHTVPAPIQGIFVEATLQGGSIVYHDNTPELLDDNEKKEYKQ